MIAVFTGLKNETIDHKKAHELSNAAGKLINTVALQLKYSLQRNEIPEIDFLEVGAVKPTPKISKNSKTTKGAE
jgi:hypothetical protein